MAVKDGDRHDQHLGRYRGMVRYHYPVSPVSTFSADQPPRKLEEHTRVSPITWTMTRCSCYDSPWILCHLRGPGLPPSLPDTLPVS
ncbi:hypothetical protein G7K_6666-t1 [Saitoella complicata NRRL Y-17804]|uniref:Uncharacterized protein n=1 Tax=Saitoella complicata (strain BCRC 22490 / CBS 7301 / JCM 7358 / NBRC 10748 / NRRL Y-17804) TaxID=698492 RepID=A0A0E9NS47_SAICN|nr:hypothetical protein G7K_6666-t1 [Saitoella complicata NRRL Y-17804]